MHRTRIGPLAVGAALAVTAVAGAGAASAAPASARTRVINECSSASYKPTKYVLECGDGTQGMTKAKYTSWSADAATGSGQLWYNTCTPNCASGKIKYEHVTFRLYRVRDTTRDGELFTRMKVMSGGRSQVYYLPTSPA